MVNQNLVEKLYQENFSTLIDTTLKRAYYIFIIPFLFFDIDDNLFISLGETENPLFLNVLRIDALEANIISLVKTERATVVFPKKKSVSEELISQLNQLACLYQDQEKIYPLIENYMYRLQASIG